MKVKFVLCALLCALLPVAALAVEPGVVEEAPPVEMDAIAEPAAYAYLPDESYYADSWWEPEWAQSETWVESEQDEGGMYYDVSQNPCLTQGEVKRAEKLLEAYKAGKVSYMGESVLGKMEDVIVGVYALDPVDYDGERAYVLLPGPCLTDEQLLAIIAAFDEMGLEFDPASLNYRNCARGGGIETNRFFSEEERERYTNMADWIRRGQLAVPEGIKGWMLNPEIDSRYYCGLPDFTLRPYRAMTDEEMVAQLVAMGVHDERGEIDHAAVESRSRNALYTAFGCPLSMENIGLYTAGAYTPYLLTAEGRKGYDYAAEARASYGANFSYYTPDGIHVYADAVFDKERNELVSMYMMHDTGARLDGPPDNTNGMTQEKTDAAIAEVEARLNLTGLAWHIVAEDETLTDWGKAIPVRTQLEKEWLFTIYIGKNDGQLRGMELIRGTLVEEIVEPDWGPNG